MTTIKAVFETDWARALAAGAYFLINGRNSEILDEFEEVPSIQTYRELESNLRQLNVDVESLNLLASEVAVSYVVERTSSSRVSLGGPLTLFGHASNNIIELGFISLLCSALDNSQAFEIFKMHQTVDRRVTKALNTRQIENISLDFELRQELRENLENVCEALREKASLNG
jgi:hypothetical protein